MAIPHPQGNKSDSNFNKVFLEYVKNKPFYVIMPRTDKPLLENGIVVANDGVGELYYVGDLLGGNFVFDPNSRIEVYYHVKYDEDEYIREDGTYWVETVIDNFERGVWVLVEWYENGLNYENVIKNLSSIKDFNPFDNLNESEEDLDWAIETVNNPAKLGSFWKNDSLRVGDVISLYGEVKDSQHVLFTLKGEKFKVADITYGNNSVITKMQFEWLTPLELRPDTWKSASSGNYFDSDTRTMFPTKGGGDCELVVEFVKDGLTESNELDWVKDLGGEMFGQEVKYNFLRTGDEIMFTTDHSFRGCGFNEEIEKGKILKTNGTKFLVLTDNITFCGPNLRNWSDGSNTMLESLITKCKSDEKHRHHYHNCVEIDRYTQSKYYMVKSREELNESNKLEYPITVGMPIYCHSPIDSFEDGKWYRITEIEYNIGNNGEDAFRIFNNKTQTDSGLWTIQKDENGLNYENWFSLGDPSFDTHSAFDNLYENTNEGTNLEDGTTIVFPYEYKVEDVYKVLHWLKQNGWGEGYTREDLRQMLYNLGQKWNIGKKRPFFMLRKGGRHNELPTIYWGPTGELDRNPSTFSKVINAEDLLSSIDTDFFITESIDDFSWTEDVLTPLNNCDKTVIVTKPGHHYGAYLNAMAELDVPYALDLVEPIRRKYNTNDISDNRDSNWNNGMREDHSRALRELESKNVLGHPIKGDVCCLYDKSWSSHTTIYRLIRLKDGKNFLMNNQGFEDYTPGMERLVGDHWTNLDEQKEWFDQEEDFSKYLKVGQRFSYKSRIPDSNDTFTGQIVNVNQKYVWVAPINQVTKKPNPYTRGTKFTVERLIWLLVSGDWKPIKS